MAINRKVVSPTCFQILPLPPPPAYQRLVLLQPAHVSLLLVIPRQSESPPGQGQGPPAPLAASPWPVLWPLLHLGYHGLMSMSVCGCTRTKSGGPTLPGCSEGASSAKSCSAAGSGSVVAVGGGGSVCSCAPSTCPPAGQTLCKWFAGGLITLGWGHMPYRRTLPLTLSLPLLFLWGFTHPHHQMTAWCP